jgi:ABC-type uncharacterized transport system substrate-binding protein
MRQIVRRLWLGLALIAGVSGGLLLSDWHQHAAGARAIRRVAIFKFNSRPILDEGVEGAIDGLRRKGLVHGRNIQLQQFNAENDLPTANSISRSLADGSFDLVLTVSTPCLQTMAAANTAGKAMHVFGVVTDPFASGVGLDRSKPLGHPRHMIGVGTFQPVRDAFLLARKANPQLRRVGSVWNPAEACSEACMRIARATARELGIELAEANVESSTAVYEAANSLVARGVEALFVGGDNTVDVAIKSVVKAANRGRIPVFTCTPANIESGVLLGLGADYREVGRTIGELAGDVLNGYDPAKYAIADVLPKKLALNLAALAQVRGPWHVPDDMRASAALGIDEKGGRWHAP